MKSITNLIEKLNNAGINKTTVAYKLVLKALTNGEKLIRPAYTSGSGRYIKLQDHTNSTIEILKKIGVSSVELKNDSPRGGKTGNFIIIAY